MRATLLMALAAAAFVRVGAAQQAVVRGPDPEVVRIGGEASLVVEFSNGGGEPRLGPVPVIPGVNVIAGGRTSTLRQAFVDGRLQDRPVYEWEMTLLPHAAGVVTTPPFSVDEGGATFVSASARLEVAAEGDGVGGRAFVESFAEPRACFLHETFRLRIRILVEARLLAEEIVPSFSRATDVPVQLCARFLGGFPGAAPLAANPVGGGRKTATLAFDDEVVAAEVADFVERDGVRFAAFEIVRTFRATRSGPLTVPAPVLRFAYGTRFEDDFLSGRRAVDRTEALVVGAPARVDVLPLPAAGRPEGFSGAVGRFEVSAEASPRELRVGETVRVSVRIASEESSAPDAGLALPLAVAPPGFRLLGRLERVEGSARVVVADLTPTDDAVREIPSLSFSAFDPAPQAGYRVLRTEAIPLVVRPGASLLPPTPAAIPDAVGGPGVDDLFAPPPAAPRARFDLSSPKAGIRMARILTIVLVLVGVAGAARLLLIARRPTPEVIRARRAARSFRRASARRDADVRREFVAYFAARMNAPEIEVYDASLAARLEAIGVEADVAGEATALRDRLAAAAYSGAAESPSFVEASQVVADVERSLRKRGRR